MARLLVCQALLERLHQLVPTAERFNLGLFFVRQHFFSELAQPFFRDLRGDILIAQRLQPLEDMGEHTVEFVDMLFILHQDSAREIVEFLDIAIDRIFLQCFKKGEIFLQADRHFCVAKCGEKGLEHDCVSYAKHY